MIRDFNIHPACTVKDEDEDGAEIWKEPNLNGEQQHFFIENEHYGSILAQPVQRQGVYYQPSGQAFFCPECSRLWANCPVDGRRTMVWSCPCEKEVFGNTIWKGFHYPGSIWLSWDMEWNKCLPKKVLAREFILCYGTVTAHESQ